MLKKIDKLVISYTNYLVWLIALFSLLGSLYFSEILHFPPCALCWYQRIAIYPLVLLVPVGIIRKDKNLPYYVLPLSVIGGLIAFFHNLLYYKVIPESAGPCTLGVSCTTKYIEWLGFVSIPLLSLLAFIVITALMIYSIKRKG